MAIQATISIDILNTNNKRSEGKISEILYMFKKIKMLIYFTIIAEILTCESCYSIHPID